MSVFDYRHCDDEQLLAQCRFEAFRGPGPGGQKRNKTSSAVRLTHISTGVGVIAGESRSQHRNREMALRRLRHRLVLEYRQSVDPDWRPAKGWADIGMKSEGYLAVMGAALDVLAGVGWSVSGAAGALGVTTGQMVGFLRRDEKLWAEVNKRRAAAGLRTLVGK